MRHLQCWTMFAFLWPCLFAPHGAADSPARDATATASFVRHEAPAPSTAERYCAWFADRGGGLLYFGAAAFWSGLRASKGEDPARDFAVAGPRPIGRFDLLRQAHLPPLDASRPGARSGVWDVLQHANGRIYFTTFFETAGYVDPGSGQAAHFEAAGTGLNELAPGPGETILATRYATEAGGGGSVVVLDPHGGIVAEHALDARTPGFQLAAKTAVLDPIRGDIWVNSDLLPAAGREDGVRGPGGSWGAAGHPTLVLDREGRERARFDDVEIQAMAFGPDGTGYFAAVESTVWAEGERLSLLILGPGERAGDPQLAFARARRVLLDGAYPRALDFAQTLDVDEAGRVVVTRWSGHVHVLERAGSDTRAKAGAEGVAWSLRSSRLPACEPGGLYYAATLAGGRLCATYCGGVSVVCGPASALLPGPARAPSKAPKSAPDRAPQGTAPIQLR